MPHTHPRSFSHSPRRPANPAASTSTAPTAGQAHTRKATFNPFGLHLPPPPPTPPDSDNEDDMESTTSTMTQTRGRDTDIRDWDESQSHSRPRVGIVAEDLYAGLTGEAGAQDISVYEGRARIRLRRERDEKDGLSHSGIGQTPITPDFLVNQPSSSSAIPSGAGAPPSHNTHTHDKPSTSSYLPFTYSMPLGASNNEKKDDDRAHYSRPSYGRAPPSFVDIELSAGGVVVLSDPPSSSKHSAHNSTTAAMHDPYRPAPPPPPPMPSVLPSLISPTTPSFHPPPLSAGPSTASSSTSSPPQAAHALLPPPPLPVDTSRPLADIIRDRYNSYSPASTSLRTSRQTKQFFDSPAVWLGMYFAFNLGLTLYNKGVLVRFPFPYTLTAVHALCGSIGCWIALEMGYFKPQPLTVHESITLGAFSVLYTVNIAVSNISLQLVTVPFHQVVRAATPLFTIALSAALIPQRGRPGPARLMSLIPVIAGVGFATYGDYYFTAWGLILTLLGTFLAACKTIVTNLLQAPPSSSSSTNPSLTGVPPAPSTHKQPRPTAAAKFRTPQLHPLDLLLRMSPLAFVQCVVYAYMSGELEHVRAFGASEMTRGRAMALLWNGVIAFGLNVVSFTANKRTGPLTMTVAANVKQVLTIVLAVMIFDLTITPTNLLGIVLTLAGGGWYGAIEYREKRRARVMRGD